MWVDDYKIINNFLTETQIKLIVDWVNSIDKNQVSSNHHITEISKDLNGKSHMFDISKTDISKYITNFQSGNDVLDSELPTFIDDLIYKICDTINIPKENMFMQIINMHKGGKINPHYDTAINGFITYKCNVNVLSEDYTLNVDKEIMYISQYDLYCFEASLYKHWTEYEFNSHRILLSFGFILPYDELGRTENDYRVRLSKRIENYFQK